MLHKDLTLRLLRACSLCVVITSPLITTWVLIYSWHAMAIITNVTCYISDNVVVELVSVCVLHCHMNHVIFQQTQAFCSEIHMSRQSMCNLITVSFTKYIYGEFLQTVSSTMFMAPGLYLNRKFPTKSGLFNSSPTKDLARSLWNIS